jgi:hypothetical protein
LVKSRHEGVQLVVEIVGVQNVVIVIAIVVVVVRALSLKGVRCEPKFGERRIGREIGGQGRIVE